MDRAVEIIASVPMRSSLYGGLAGLAWPLAHFERLGLSVGEALDLLEVDEVLTAGVEQFTHRFDLISGLVGVGVYFLERLPARSAAAGLARVVRRLADLAERDADGLRWHTPIEIILPDQADRWPAGRYDLGVAHGVPGVVALLALTLLKGGPRAPAEAMLREAVRWLCAHGTWDSGDGVFPTMLDARGGPLPRNRRAAWCYGDPGIAVALLLAARALDDTALASRARTLALTSARLARAHRGAVRDMSLCHGSAGLAHVFGVLGRALDEPTLVTDAAAWHAVSLALRDHDVCDTGVFFARLKDDGVARGPDWSFLQGAPGVGLSLLWSLDPAQDRSWDRMLLMS